MLTNDPLDVACADITTAAFVKLPREYEPDLFFDGDSFLYHLRNNYSAFDVATYSFTTSALAGAPLRNIRRLIVGLRPLRGLAVKAEQVRFIPNIHLKLFLCYTNDALSSAYLGSQNLTHGTNLNIMYRARTKHTQPLLGFFNSLWTSK